MDKDFYYKIIKPDESISDFVDSFWVLHNQSDFDKETIGLPDGRIDLFLVKSDTEPFNMALLGVGTQIQEHAVIPANSLRFAIGFKLLAVEYILQESISEILNKGKIIANDYWDFTPEDLENFDAFCEKATQKIQSLIPKEIDPRKKKLSRLIYETNGTITVHELSENIGWSSRQINRYFNQQFGVSLKVYCNIIRFRASLEHIAKGQLFPELNFSDQTHFIKEIKKITGFVPKELFKNKNDRFILLSSLNGT